MLQSMGSKRVTHGTEQQQNKYFPRSVSQGNRDKSKSKQMGPNLTFMLLHSKGNHEQNENITYGLGENTHKQCDWSRASFSKHADNSGNSKSKTTQWKKWAEDLNRHFFKEDTQMANRHMKRSSMPIIKEMQVKTAMRHYLTWVRMTIIKESTGFKNRKNA